MNNPSEIMRTVEERAEYLRGILSGRNSKYIKREALRELRSLEREYGVDLYGEYNSTPICNKIAARLSCPDCGYPENEAAGCGDHLGPCDITRRRV